MPPIEALATPPAATGARPALPAAQRRAATQTRVAEAFSQIVAVLMRYPGYRGLTLAELESLVLPPLMAGQYRIAHAGTTTQQDAVPAPGLVYPVALALWARVSPAVDARLSKEQHGPARLQPSEWVSGDIPWLMVVAGHPRAIPAFLEQLKEAEFNGRELKMRVRVAGTGGLDTMTPPSAVAS